MQCPRCHTGSSPRARFCLECGLSLTVRCVRCSVEMPQGAKFCPECGLSVATREALPVAAHTDWREFQTERRQVTVLFCDLVGSTELTRMLGERYYEILRACLTESESVVRAYGGHVAQRLGDGLLVYFGFPEAHEDDARRAVSAGLKILEAIRQLDSIAQRQHNVRLATRIGIDTGLVVAGLIGEGAQSERLAFGETPNMASRIKDAAEPGALVISARTCRLVDGYFELLDLGSRELKGLGLVSVYQVQQEGAARTRLEVLGFGGLTPLANRTEEAAHLRDRWHRVTADGRGHMVLLCGEPGIGKSRLARAIEDHVKETANSHSISCLASPYHQHTAFYPIIDLLERSVLDLPSEAASPAVKSLKLEQWLRQQPVQIDDALPLFKRLLSIVVDDRDTGPVRDAVSDRQRMMEYLQQILSAMARRRPTLLVCEDLHWADASTLELLDSFATELPDLPLLVVMTFRSEFRPPWVGRSYVTHLTIERLKKEPSKQLATAILGNTLPSSVLEQVLLRADGNPLFIEELGKSIRESTVTQDAGLRVASSLPGHTLTIPATLRDSLMARLDRIPGAKRVAPLCAALGREFSYELLCAVADIDETLIASVLRQLVDAELLFPMGTTTHPVYIFKHALIREIAYDLMLKNTRLTLHRRIAEVLLARFPEVAARQPELVAQHFSESGKRELSIPYWQAAGQRALERAANVEAISHFEHALALVKSALPAGPARDEHELQVLNLLAPAYMAIKGWASVEVERACRRTLALSGSAGDFGALWGLWTNYFLRGKLQQALDVGYEVLKLALAAQSQGTSDEIVNLEVMARHAVGYTHFYRAEFKEACQHAEAGLARQVTGADGTFHLEGERKIVRLRQFSSSAALRMMLGSSLWMLGFPDQGRKWIHESVELTKELGHFPAEAYALAASLLPHYYEMDIEHIAAASQRLFDIARNERFEIWTPFALMFRGWVKAEQQQGAEAEAGIKEIRSGLEQWQATGSYLNQSILKAMLARSLWKSGRVDEALAALDDEIIDSKVRTEMHFAPEWHRLKGEILLGLGKIAEAEVCMEVAIELARSQQARMLELRAMTSIAPLWARTGRQALARERLQGLYATFTEGSTSADLLEARRVLQALESGPRQMQRDVTAGIVRK